MALVAE